jgi:uncharacterized protein
MPLPIDINSTYAASGFGVGLLVGLTGVGGGSLMTPLLILLFGIHPTTAVGTDLLQASITKSVGSLIHGANHTVDWRIVGRLVSGSLPATVCTLLLLYSLGIEGNAASHLVSFVLGVALLVTAVSLVFRPQILRFAERRFGTPDLRTSAVTTVVTGAVIGVIVSLSSIGAGALGVTVLLLLYPTLPTSRIVGSDIAHAVPLTLVAGLGHWLLGSVDWPLLGSLLTGSIPGIIIGSYMAARVPDLLLRPMLATTLVLVGARLVR